MLYMLKYGCDPVTNKKKKKEKENKIVIFRLIETFKQNEKKISNFEDNSYS